MSFGISVKGGTGAGRKRPLHDPYKPWACECLVSIPGARSPHCEKLNPGYLKRCIDCGTRRER